MASRIRTPLGHVHYFGTPPGDDRFTFPNIPSWNFPGVTGWAALPPDNRGFRVRLRGSAPTDPDTSDRAFDRSYDAHCAHVSRGALSAFVEGAAARDARVPLRDERVGKFHHRPLPGILECVGGRRRDGRRIQVRAGRGRIHR